MLPLSQTVRLWRLKRGLTQEALARATRLSRPNLSAIERGRREVSLGTLRALALGLGVRPGVLADGLPPAVRPGQTAPLSRAAMERVADAVVRGSPVRNPFERTLADSLRRVVRHRLAALRGGRAVSHRGVRAAEAAWRWLESSVPAEAVQSLVQRITDRAS
jgi:transcriptional regulator with XRE-family HTH domain